MKTPSVVTKLPSFSNFWGVCIERVRQTETETDKGGGQTDREGGREREGGIQRQRQTDTDIVDCNSIKCSFDLLLLNAVQHCKQTIRVFVHSINQSMNFSKYYIDTAACCVSFIGSRLCPTVECS